MELKGKINAIVQARMGSTRLPGKTLMNIKDKPMLWHIINRLKYVKEINHVIIATSDSHEDNEIYKMAKKFDIDCFRGSESDVLNRFYGAAKDFNSDHIIRITGDCPLIDPLTIKKLIKLYFLKKYDYSCVACGAAVSQKENINFFPDGLDAEIFSFKVLTEAYNEAQTKLYREHVTPFIWKNIDRYNIGTLYSETDFSHLRLTVDNLEDFELVKTIYDLLYDEKFNFNLDDIVNLINSKPDLVLNSHLIGQEGYNDFWK